MKHAIGVVADWFGTVSFIIGFNIVTALWIIAGTYISWFFDHWPFIFFTFVVSWAAINMTSFVLFKDNRNAERERQSKETQRKQLEALVRNMEEVTLISEQVQQIARNQVYIMNEIMKRKEG